jgi:UDP-glucuronate 4-epimerase
MKILVTGAAGFIGFHTAARLLDDGHIVTGIDNLNPYYDPSLKQARLAQLNDRDNFRFEHMDLADAPAIDELVSSSSFDRIVHLAAQAGVRYSLESPGTYVQSNLVGFANLLEACRHAGTPHLVFASSSSVYGANRDVPFSEHRPADHPVSLYAASKRANELMAHSYSSLFGLPVTGLRFFTVYGPWGRPDMALFLFTRAILDGEPIKVFNHGHHQRDFTYIDDVVEGVVRVADSIPAGNPDWQGENPDPATGNAPYRLYNIGNSQPVQLNAFIEAIENKLGKKALREELPMQPGDLPDTWADCTDLEQDFGYQPTTPLEEGISRFVDWYLDHYHKH